MSKPVQRPFAKVSAVADDPGRLPRPALQSLALTLAVILITMTTIVKPAYALGTVAPAAPLWCSNPDFSSTCIYSTKEAACVA